MILDEFYTLKNGYKIPKLSLGTWQSSIEDAKNATFIALKNGYRHIDTAAAYGNEEGVGEGIKNSGIPREKIFVTTKIPAEVKTYDGAKKSIAESLRKLDLDYIDLMLIHAPKPWSEMFQGEKRYLKENLEVWKAMEEAYNDGKIRSLGVSNFDVVDMENISNNAAIKPVVNQIGLHVGWLQKDIISYCNKTGIIIMAYSPLGTGRLLDNPLLKEMARKYGVSVPQLCIRFTLELGTVSVPKSVHEKYIIDNTKVDFKIKDEDLKTLLNF